MDNFASIESMLFGIHEIAKDTDAISLKKDIDCRIKTLSEKNDTIDMQNELEFAEEVFAAVSTSFINRERQMIIDVEIVRKINKEIDIFREEHKLKVDGLIFTLMSDVDEAVNEYANVIIKELDPKRIKERFSNKGDFQWWLTTRNEHYKNKMEKTVERRTQSALSSYLIDVEAVFEIAVSYLDNREEALSIQDPFYGSLAESKRLIVRDTRNTIKEFIGYNKNLYEASEDLFHEIWEARQRYDKKRFITEAAVSTAGSLAAGALINVGVKAVAAKIVGGAIAIKALPIVASLAAFVVSALVINHIASKLSESLYSGSLERDVKSCIDEFLEEIDKSKNAMKIYLTENVKDTFNNELKSLDRTFLDFRKTTYIDEDKIPLLAEKVKALEDSFGSEDLS